MNANSFLCILYFWPEDDLLMSKHETRLKVQHLIVVQTAMYFSCWYALLYDPVLNVSW